MPTKTAFRRKTILIEAIEPRILMSAASRLVVTGQPSDVTAGAADALTVSFEDAGGTVDSSETGQVTLTIGTGPTGATLGGTATATASGGVATFNNIVLTQSGSYTLTTASPAMISATTSTFAVSAGAFTQFIFTQQPSSSVIAGQPLTNFAFAAVDSYGNPTGSRDGDTIDAFVEYGMNYQQFPVILTGGTGTLAAATLDTAGSYIEVELYDQTMANQNNGTYYVFSNYITVVPAAPAKLVVTGQPVTTVAGVAIPTVAVSVEDAYGNLETADTSDVTIATGAVPSGTGLGGTLSVAAAGGVATFSDLTLTKAGSNTLVASDGLLTSATTTAFTIAAATGTHLVFTQLPATTVAGQHLQDLQVTLEDPFGNAATNLNGSAITVTADDGTPYNAGLVNGVATYTSVVLSHAGPHTVTASYSSLGFATQSPQFTIVPAAAARIVFSGTINPAVAGTAISGITVSVLDLYGNIVTGDPSSVTISLDSLGTLDGTKTAAAHNGLAVFSNLSITQAGYAQLEAVDGLLPTVISDPFAVNAAAAVKLVLTDQPQATQVAGAVLSSLNVTLEDAYGNSVTSDSSAVTVAASVAPAGASVAGTTTETVIAGMAVFTRAKLTRVGNYNLTFTDGSLTPVTTSSFTIVPGAPAQLVFDQQPTDVTAGEAMPAFTVEVDDAFGNLVTTADTTVLLTLASNPSGAAAAGNLIATADAGVAAFSGMQLTHAGNYALAAVGGQGVEWALSSTFSVSAGPAARLVVASQPNTATAGEPVGPVVVDVEDAFGNLVSTDSSGVTITSAIAPAGAGVAGTTTVAAVGGVATFSDLSVPTAGSYLFSTGDSGLSPAFTAPITVAGPAAPVVPVTPVTPVTPVPPALPTIAAGAVMSPWSVSVTAPSGGRTTSATLSIESGPAGAKVRGRSVVRTKTASVSFSGLSLDTAGQYTIKVTAADGTVTTRTLAITAGTAVHAKFGGTTAVQTVTLTDRFGNVVPDGTAVTLTLVSTTRGVTPVAASASTIGGVATFTPPTVLPAGRYRLIATAGQKLRVASSWFTAV